MLSRRDVLSLGSAAALGFAWAARAASVPLPRVNIGELSLEEKVGQLFLLAFEGPTVKDAQVMLGDYLVGGLYLSQDNLRDVRQAVS